MRFRSKLIEIEANQFIHGAPSPIGVRTREGGSCYVVTFHGQQTDVVLGDWIILENPPGDGTLAYACKPDVFEKRYEQADWRIGLSVRPKYRFHRLFAYSNKCIVIATRDSSIYKDGLLLIAVDDGRELLDPAEQWVAACGNTDLRLEQR